MKVSITKIDWALFQALCSDLLSNERQPSNRTHATQATQMWLHLSFSILHAQFNNAKSNIPIWISSRSPSIRFETDRKWNNRINWNYFMRLNWDFHARFPWHLLEQIKFNTKYGVWHKFRASTFSRLANNMLSYAPRYLMPYNNVDYLCKPFIVSVENFLEIHLSRCFNLPQWMNDKRTQLDSIGAYFFLLQI